MTDPYDDLVKEWLEKAHVVDLERQIKVPEGFLLGLMSDEDWSFVVKAHAFAEAAVTHLLVIRLREPRLYDVFARLEMSNAATGKLAFVSAGTT